MSEEFDVVFNKDDEQALRILSLALLFTNKASPVDSSFLHDNYYSSVDTASFQRAFRRDRDRLALCGVIVDAVEDSFGQSAWRLNAATSLAGQARLTPQEALMLVVATSPVANDPSFAYADELRMALAKVSNSFEGLSPAPLANTSTNQKLLKSLRSCLENRCLAQVSYTPNQGKTKDYVLAIMGFFGLRGKLYFVAEESKDKASPSENADAPSYKTFLVDRVSKLKALPEQHYEIPADFTVDDYIRLPFQIGEGTYDFELFVPQPRYLDVRARARGQGSWTPQDGGYLWHVDAKDVLSGASWAIAEGVKPIGPPELVEAYRGLLEGVLAHG